MNAITLLRAPDGRAVNKVVSRAAAGIQKAMARNDGVFAARTIAVPDAATMADVLRDVGDHQDATISLGVFVGAPDETFLVVPLATLARVLKLDLQDPQEWGGFHEINGVPVTARKKINMRHGSWLLFDRDNVKGMPPELSSLTRDGWLGAMDLLVPGIARARRVLLPSTSQRVVVDGVPLHSDSFHLFVQVADPGEIPRVWPQLLPKSFLVELEPGRPLGFLRPKFARADPTRVVAHQPWSIFDPSTGSPERLVFDGKPMAMGEGIEVAPPEVEAFEGDPLDLSAFQDLGDAAIPVVEHLTRTRIKVERAGNGAGVRIVGVQFTSPTLSMDLEVETERGWTTVGELHAQGAGHTRMQSPFRDSTSWAAYYGTHRNGSPFIYDTGINTKYVLPDAPGQPDDEPPWPDPPGDAAFHGLAGEVVRAIEPHTEADPAAILLSSSPRSATPCGRGPHVQVEGDRHCAQLYVALVGETAKARKGTSWGRVRQLMALAAPGGRTASGMSSGEGLIWQVRDPITKMVKGEEVTVDEGVSDKRLLIVEPEFATALRQCERAGNTLSSVLRAFWDTGDVQSLTKNSPARTTGALISIVAHITADELRRYLTRTELGNGFGNRFLFGCVRRSKVLPFGGGELDLAPLAAQVEGLVNRARFGALKGRSACSGPTRPARPVARGLPRPVRGQARPARRGHVARRGAVHPARAVVRAARPQRLPRAAPRRGRARRLALLRGLGAVRVRRRPGRRRRRHHPARAQGHARRADPHRDQRAVLAQRRGVRDRPRPAGAQGARPRPVPVRRGNWRPDSRAMDFFRMREGLPRAI